MLPDIVSCFFWSPMGLVITFICLFVAYVWYRFGVQPYSHFKKRNIGGPKPKPFMGSMGELAKYQGRPLDSYSDFLKEYGRTYGIFLGWTPILVTVEPELVKQIFVKNFDKFSVRSNNQGILSPRVGGKKYSSLVEAKGEDWKKRRRILSPAFSGHKLRMMEPLIKESTERLTAKISEMASEGKSIEVLSLYSRFTMEVILSVGMGRSVDVLNGKGGQLYSAACTIFRVFANQQGGKLMQAIMNLSLMFPFLNPLLGKIVEMTEVSKAMYFVCSAAEEIVKERRSGQGPNNRKDLIQLMIDASDETDAEIKLTDGEIITDSMSFMLAGYETSSNFLMFASYLLAVNQDVQDKLHQSIASFLEENPDKSMYDACAELDYLDMVFNEVLRLYPPGYLVVRTCTEACTVEGLRFDKGDLVFVPVYHLHRDEAIWESPETFDPERCMRWVRAYVCARIHALVRCMYYQESFLRVLLSIILMIKCQFALFLHVNVARFSPSNVGDRHSCSHIPFGLGPRNCVGTRLAIYESKMALIAVLNSYKIVTAPETEDPLKLSVGITLTVKEGLYLKFEPRD